MRKCRRTIRRLGSATAAATVLVATAVLPAPTASAGVAGVRGSSIAFDALDSGGPIGAVGGVQSPIEAGDTLHLLLDASDTGPGLAVAEASIDGNTTVVPLGGAGCPTHPVAGTTEPPPGGECPQSVSEVPLAIDVGGEGSHELLVSVTDAAGNTTTLLEQTIVVEPDLSSTSSATVTIGVGSGSTGEATGETEGKAKRGVLGVKEGPRRKSSCRSPKLSMRLASKPLRYAKQRVPVLRVGLRYRYRGRLTCVRSGKRVSAPKATSLHVIYKVAPSKFKTRKLTVGRKGALGIVLRPARRTRSFLFRYRPAGGESMQVKLHVKVVRPVWCSLSKAHCGRVQLGVGEAGVRSPRHEPRVGL